MKEVFVLIFDRPCNDCNGVYSTKEKAIKAFETHAERCKDIWLDIEIAADDENYRCYEFYVDNEVIAADIYKVVIDE